MWRTDRAIGSPWFANKSSNDFISIQSSLSIEICNLQIIFDKFADNEKIVTEKAITIKIISKMVIMILIVINTEHNIIKNNKKKALVAGKIKKMLYNLINK